MPSNDKHRKLTEDMPLGARIGMNIMLAAAPPTLRRHAVRRLEAGQRPVRKTRAERQREWEIEQANKARRNGGEWTPGSSSPWDEGESGSDGGVGALGADEKQAESRRSRGSPPRDGDESDVESGTRTPSRSSRPPGFTGEPRQNPINDGLCRGRRPDQVPGGNATEGRDNGAEPSRTTREPQTSNSMGYSHPPAPDLASMTTGYQRIYRWSSQVQGVPAADDAGTSVSTAWPGPDTDQVAPSESISVVGDGAADEGLYRRGRIAPSSRGSEKRSESTKWS